uniref:Thymidine kinase n=1 Tax=Arcella intermedia TaxID=1963864 RepID=A0A6B2LGL3_9EUKA
MSHGSIQIIFGPMFSGKSTELLRRIRRYTVAKRKCLVLKYEHDTRYSKDKMSTHDQIVWTAVPCTVLETAKELSLEYDVIGIDEGQFFPDVVSFSEHMADLGKVVIVAALDGTFQRKPFGSILELVPLAEHVTKLTAVCVICQGDASFSKRLVDETQVELIGGEDKYIAVCRQCYHLDVKNRVQPQSPPATFLLVSPSKNSPTLPKEGKDGMTPTKLQF